MVKELIKALMVNDLLFNAMLLVSLICFIYICYFFFSQEGRDERGRGIFASASMIVFVIMFALLNLISLFGNFFLGNYIASFFSVNFVFFIYCFVQAISILILRRKR